LTAAQALASQPNSRDDENCYCTDNAVAAVIKCVARHSDVVDIQGSLNLAINYLPFTHDIDEMETCFEYIVDLMNSNLDFVLGANHVNLTKLIQGMAIVLWHTTYNTDSAARVKIIAVCKNMAARADLLGKMQAVLGRVVACLHFNVVSLLRAAREDLVDQDAREAFTKALSS
jgi:hypothetical protein